MSLTSTYFIAGTDTGVGKTTVAAGILASLARRGISVAALKPAETGCARAPDGELVPDDGSLLESACALGTPALTSLTPRAAVPLRYTTPVAPAIAARLEGRPFDLLRVVAARDELLATTRPQLLLVEGAGGLLVPFSDELLAADLARSLAPRLLLVARASLGTINHTLLTIEAARRRDLTVAGVILSRVLEPRGPDEATNAAEITRLSGVPVLGTVPHVPAAARRDPRALADALESAFDPASLLVGVDPA